MLSKKLNLSRFAFTMIELLFAIVIIAIAVLSLPVMTQVNARGVENNLVQEAIFSASAELMAASTGYWDLNSMQDNNSSSMSRVIDIGNVCNNNTLSTRHRLRPGHIDQPMHRRCLNNSGTDPANINDPTFVNLDNAAHAFENIFIDTVTNASGYKESYQSRVAVSRTNNIKTVTITVANSKTPATTLVVLRMQSANIGEVDFFSRSF